MSDMVIKKLAHIFENQQKILEKLASGFVVQAGTNREIFNTILDEIHMLERSVHSNADVPQHVKSGYLSTLNKIENLVSILAETTEKLDG